MADGSRESHERRCNRNRETRTCPGLIRLVAAFGCGLRWWRRRRGRRASLCRQDHAAVRTRLSRGGRRRRRWWGRRRRRRRRSDFLGTEIVDQAREDAVRLELALEAVVLQARG